MSTPMIETFWRNALLSVACLGAASCAAPLRDDWPPLDESRAKDIVAVIDVISVRDYEQDSCFGYEIQDSNGRAYVLCATGVQGC
jgi:hypothetical protein